MNIMISYFSKTANSVLALCFHHCSHTDGMVIKLLWFFLKKINGLNRLHFSSL